MISKFAVAALAGASFAAVGCSDNKSDKHHNGTSDRGHGGVADKSDPRTDRPEDYRGTAGRYGGGLDSIPREAERLTNDEGNEMHVRPNVNGRLYIYDDRDDRIVYEGPLRRHEELVAIPDRGTLTIDNKRLDENIRWNPKAHYRLYFLRD